MKRKEVNDNLLKPNTENIDQTPIEVTADETTDNGVENVADSISLPPPEVGGELTMHISKPNDKHPINKFDIFWMKVWAWICSFIEMISKGINVAIKFVFRKEAPLKYIKASVSTILIIIMVALITAPFNITVNKSEEVDIFPNGFIAVQTQQGFDEFDKPVYKWGYADKKGKLKINCVFDNAMDFKHGVAWVMVNDKVANANYWHLIDKKGKQKGDIKILQSRANVAPVGQFSDKTKLAWVYTGGKYSFINTKGKLVFNQQFDDCGSFIDGLARVKLGNSQYYINSKGAQVGEDYEEVRDFHDGFGAVKKNDLWGFVNNKGKLIIGKQFDRVSDFKGEYCLVKSGSTYGIVNNKGEEVVSIGNYVGMGILEYFNMPA